MKTKACIPEMKTSVPDPYDWQERHQSIIAANKARNPQLVLLGDSIIHYWGGVPEHPIKRGADSWEAVFGPYNAVNMGFGMDQTQHMLWRIQNGELDGISPRVVILEGGSNNYRTCEDWEIAEGMRCLVDEISARLPDAQILLFGMTPNAKNDARALALNAEYAKLDGAKDGKVRYLDVGAALRGADGEFIPGFFEDGCHPNAEGNRRLAAVVKPVLDEMMARSRAKVVDGVFVIDDIANLGKYASLGRNFPKAIDFLLGHDLAKLAPGRHEIDGDNCFATVSDTELVPVSERKPELHRRYFDIQLPVSGPEVHGVADFNSASPGEFDEARDIGFYEQAVSYYGVGPRQFAIFAPGRGLHAPACTDGDRRRTIRKVVVKVLRDC